MESSPRTEGDKFAERIKSLYRVLQAAKIVKQDNVPCKIEEGLYIGSLGAAYNKSTLQSLNVTHILTVANSLAPAHPNDFTYHTIQVSDRVDAPISQYFDGCFAFIEEARRIGGGVLVHCFAGKSRRNDIVVISLPEAAFKIKRTAKNNSPEIRGYIQLQ